MPLEQLETVARLVLSGRLVLLDSVARPGLQVLQVLQVPLGPLVLPGRQAPLERRGWLA